MALRNLVLLTIIKQAAALQLKTTIFFLLIKITIIVVKTLKSVKILYLYLYRHSLNWLA